MNLNHTLPAILEHRAASDPERIFIQEIEGEAHSFARINTDAQRWGRALRSLGVVPGVRVATLIDDPVKAVTCWIGVAWVGGIEVPINAAYKGQMLRHVLSLTDPLIVVISSIYLGRLTEIADVLRGVRAIVVIGNYVSTEHGLSAQWLDADGLLESAPDVDWHALEFRDTAAILFTSGTTGPSKGVVAPWGLVHQTARQICPSPDIGADDVFYHYAPMFHIGGKAILTAMALAGGKIALRRKFSASNFWSDIARYGCTTTFVVGTIFKYISELAETCSMSRTSPLRNILGTPLPAEVEKFEREYGLRFHTWYGSTEVGVVASSRNWHVPDSKCCGKLVEGRECRVVDENDREVPCGEVGELIVRNTEPWTLNAGYWEMPQETLRAWRNLWFHTGDAGYRDEDGNFYFIDRMKDVIRRRGENISSYEVETIVNRHLEVSESAAFPVPSKWGEDEVMIAVVRAENSTLTAHDLIRFLEASMPDFMLPRYVEFVRALPMTDTEKIRKTDLKAKGVSETTWDRETNTFVGRGGDAEKF